MLEVNPQSIVSGIRKFLDETAHAIADSRKKEAIDKLTDVLEAVKALQGLLRLPPACQPSTEKEPTP